MHNFRYQGKHQDFELGNPSPVFITQSVLKRKDKSPNLKGGLKLGLWVQYKSLNRTEQTERRRKEKQRKMPKLSPHMSIILGFATHPMGCTRTSHSPLGLTLLTGMPPPHTHTHTYTHLTALCVCDLAHGAPGEEPEVGQRREGSLETLAAIAPRSMWGAAQQLSESPEATQFNPLQATSWAALV